MIGVAGCGRMGAGMLAHLRAAGFTARGYDVIDGRGDAAPLDTFRDGLQTLISVVRDTAETDALLFDDQGLATCPTVQTIIISSTLPPPYVTATGPMPPSLMRINYCRSFMRHQGKTGSPRASTISNFPAMGWPMTTASASSSKMWPLASPWPPMVPTRRCRKPCRPRLQRSNPVRSLDADMCCVTLRA